MTLNNMFNLTHTITFVDLIKPTDNPALTKLIKKTLFAKYEQTVLFVYF